MSRYACFALRSARVVAALLAMACLAAASTTAAEPPPPAEVPAESAEAPDPIDLPGAARALLAPFQGVQGVFAAEGTVLRASAGPPSEPLESCIDWSRREILAVGRATVSGEGSQAMQMARRGAKILALRNALALAGGVPIGPNGRVDSLRDGRIEVRGLVKGFEVERTFLREIDGREEVFAVVRVPLFGVESVAARCHTAQRVAHRRLCAHLTRRTWCEPAGADRCGGDVLVIDARGTDFAPSMFPVILDSRGRIVLDMQTLPRDRAVRQGPCAYGATELPFELIERQLPVEVEIPAEPAGGAISDSPLPSRLAGGAAVSPAGLPLVLAVAEADASSETAPADPQAAAEADTPSTAPVEPVRRRPRRRAVRAEGTREGNAGILVVSDADAAALLDDPEAAGVVRGGRVLILVDAAAGGLQGLRARPLPQDLLARADR